MFTNDSNIDILIIELVLTILGPTFIFFILKDRLFSLPPSFYAIIAGALIGASINLLTGLVFIQEDVDNKSMIRGILILSICILISAVLVSYVSFYLEKLSAQVLHEVDPNKMESVRIRLDELIYNHRYVLISSLSLSWISFVVGIFQIYY